MSKKIQPLGDNFIVLPLPKEEETSNGIIIPETDNADLTEGIVVEASVEFEHLVKPGDKVIFSKGSGTGAFYNGKPHLWLKVNQIWGVVQKAK